MSTTIDQAFIKQFECCSALCNTTCGCSRCCLKLNNASSTVIYTVLTVGLVTVVELSSAVMVVVKGCEIVMWGCITILVLESLWPVIQKASGSHRKRPLFRDLSAYRPPRCLGRVGRSHERSNALSCWLRLALLGKRWNADNNNRSAYFLQIKGRLKWSKPFSQK